MKIIPWYNERLQDHVKHMSPNRIPKAYDIQAEGKVLGNDDYSQNRQQYVLLES